MSTASVNALLGIGGFIAMLLMGVSLVMILYRARHPDVRLGSMPPRALYTLIIIACTIAMIGAALRAWQFSLLGR